MMGTVNAQTGPVARLPFAELVNRHAVLSKIPRELVEEPFLRGRCSGATRPDPSLLERSLALYEADVPGPFSGPRLDIIAGVLATLGKGDEARFQGTIKTILRALDECSHSPLWCRYWDAERGAALALIWLKNRMSPDLRDCLDSEVSQHRIKREIANQQENLDMVLVNCAYYKKADLRKMAEALEQGADVNARHHGETVLMLASRSNNLDLARFLLDNGADVHARDEDGRTALMNASACGNTEMMELLLERGAEIDAAADDGTTALMASLDHAESLTFLLGRKANTEAQNKEGETALILAVKHYVAIKNIRLLLDWGARTEAEDNRVRTALHHAAAIDRDDVVCLMADRKAKLDARDDDGDSPLMAATRRGGRCSIIALLERGAPPNAMNTAEETPLRIAYAKKRESTADSFNCSNHRVAKDCHCKFKKWHWEEVIAILKEHGARRWFLPQAVSPPSTSRSALSLLC